MTVPNISSLLVGARAAAPAGLSLAGRDDFADKLQLGQIIKGRVLRHYEGGRYAVDFGGHEKVVDSAVPLHAGDLIHGRVVGLGDRVELERVRGSDQPSARASENTRKSESGSRSRSDYSSRLVAELFEQYRARLTPEQSASLEKAVRGAGEWKLMAMSALLLAKLGVGMPPDLLKVVYELLRTDPDRGLFHMAGKTLELQTAHLPDKAAHDSAHESPVAALAEFLKQSIDQVPERHLRRARPSPSSEDQARFAPDAGAAGNQQSEAHSGYDLGRWLLNVQTGGSVVHRANTIPLLVNGRLVELNIAVFEQREGPQPAGAAKHRQLSFSLHSEQLGHVEAHLLLTGEHMKMTLCADRDATSEWLAAYSPDLLGQLKADGWQVDELHYRTKPAAPATVAHTVLQHVISQDSVSRLL
jgi:hypothetical protein